MSHVNLLPDSYVAHERRVRTVRGMSVVAGTVLVVAVVWGSIAYGQLRSLELRMHAAETRLVDERNRARELDASRAALTDLKAVLAHRAQLEAPVPAPGVLALLTHLLPESVAVTKLSMELPPPDLTDRAGTNRRADAVPPPPAYVPTRVEMEGVALSDVELAKVVGTLASHKAFANVKLIRSRQVTTAGLTRFAFQITLEVPPALPPSAAAGKPVARTAEKDSRGA